MAQKIADSTSTDSEGIVVFEAGDRKVSNDPNYTGDTTAENPFRAQAAENRANLEQEDSIPDEVKRSREADQAQLQDYSQLDGKQLKAEANRRGIDIEGVRKKSQLIELLETHDRDHRDFEYTGQDIQGNPSPPAPASADDETVRGLSNDSELGVDGEDVDRDEDEDDEE